MGKVWPLVMFIYHQEAERDERRCSDLFLLILNNNKNPSPWDEAAQS